VTGPQHPAVTHPQDLLAELAAGRATAAAWNERLLAWLTDHILASVITFDVALVVPLAAIPAPGPVKLTVGVVSGSWFQLWALPALQRTQQAAERQRAAKADVDHQALTHIATVVDEIHAALTGPHDRT